MKIKRNILRLSLILSVFFIAHCANRAHDREYADIEDQVYELINQHRSNQGLEKLDWNNIIAEQCLIHSKNMADGSVEFGHSGFNERVENIKKEMTTLGAGENVAYNLGQTDPAQAAVSAWLESPGHRQNIEGNYQLTGVGVAREDDIYYLTQIFIRNK